MNNLVGALVLIGRLVVGLAADFLTGEQLGCDTFHGIFDSTTSAPAGWILATFVGWVLATS
jgi:hypothetical protein